MNRKERWSGWPRTAWLFVWCLLILQLASACLGQELLSGPQFSPVPLRLPEGHSDVGSDTVSVAELIERRRFLGASISPDGKAFAFAIIQGNSSSDNYRSALILGKTQSPKAARVVGSAGRPRWDYIGQFLPEDPQWSPDSRHFTYTRQLNGARQLWIWSVEGGAGRQLTYGSLDVLNYRWLPDGSGIVYCTRATRPNTADPLSPDPVLFTSTTMGEYGEPLLDRNKAASPRITLWRYDMHQAKAKQLDTRTAKQYEETFRSPFIAAVTQQAFDSPDGQLVANIVSTPSREKRIPESTRIAISNRLGGAVIARSPESREALQLAIWRPDGRSLLVYWSSRFGTRGLYRMHVADGTLQAISDRPGLLSWCSFDKRVEWALCRYATPTRPEDLVLVRIATGEVQQVTAANPVFDGLQLQAPHVMSWKNAYGDLRSGYVILPRDYKPGVRYPAILTSYYFDGGFLNGNGDEFPLQVLANAGLVVVCVHTPPERRRDIGLENALLDWESPLASFEAILDILTKDGTIDPKRVGIMGLSYGAELVEYSVSHSHLFSAAAATSAGTHEPWSTFFSDDAAQQSYGPGIGLPDWLEGKPDIEQWARLSTLLNAPGIEAPILIQAADRELILSIPVYRRLQKIGRPIELWSYPNEFHIKTQPRHQLEAQKRYIDWFRFWLQDEEDPDPAKAEQYKRWRELRKVQEQSMKKFASEPKNP